MSDESATDVQGFYARFGEGDGSVAHVKGNPDMSEETLGALRAALQAAYHAAQRGELKTLDEAKDTPYQQQKPNGQPS